MTTFFDATGHGGEIRIDPAPINSGGPDTHPAALMPNHYFSTRLYQSSAPFSHFVEHAGSGFTAGIIGQCSDDGLLVSNDIAEQCEAMMDTLKTLLEELGLEFSDLVRTKIYLTDYKDFEVINAVYASHKTEPCPVRTTVRAAALPLGAKVQIDTIVALRRTGDTRQADPVQPKRLALEP